MLGQMAAYVESMISVASRSAQQIDQVDSIMVSVDAGSGHTPCFANAPIELRHSARLGCLLMCKGGCTRFTTTCMWACMTVQRPG